MKELIVSGHIILEKSHQLLAVLSEEVFVYNWRSITLLIGEGGDIGWSPRRAEGVF